MVNGVLQNSRESQLQGVLTCSTLVLLGKEEHTTGAVLACKPIAMGELFLKLAAQIAVERAELETSKMFAETQMGVGTRDGGPEIVLRARDAFRVTDTAVLLSIDMKNAFNPLERQAIFNALKEKSELCELQWFQLILLPLGILIFFIHFCSFCSIGEISFP